MLHVFCMNLRSFCAEGLRPSLCALQPCFLTNDKCSICNVMKIKAMPSAFNDLVKAGIGGQSHSATYDL
jgi:hypothetical protein